MKQSPTSLAGRERTPARTDRLWKMAASVAPPAAVDDLTFARASGANVLLIGHNPQVSDAAQYVAGTAASPLTIWLADGLRLPGPAAKSLVVLARDVDGLFPDEQLQLLQWLKMANGETRVVSTASPALWPMVRDGAFNAQLYYQLNTLCIELP